MLLEGRSGRPAEVNAKYELEVNPISRAFKEAISTGLAWSIPINAVTPTGADDHFFHLKNNGANDIAIVRAILRDSETPVEAIEIYEATGTANTPTAITPVSLRVGGPSANVLAEQGADLQLTVGAFMMLLPMEVDILHDFDLTDTPIVLPQDKAILMNAITGTGAINGTIFIVQV